MSFRDNIRKVDPYVPGEQPKVSDVIKLNTNENPYPPSEKVKKALEDFDPDKLRLYPPTDGAELTEALAKRYGVTKDRVFVGVGSDDVLAVAFQTFFDSDKPVIFPDITYSFYDVWANLYRVPYKQIPLMDDFRIRREDFYGDGTGAGAGNGGVIIANPNAPTSICEGLDFIEDIVKHNQDSVVVIDEAYVDFCGISAVPLLEKYDNLVVVQTFSKSRCTAGLRIGYAISSKELITAMNDVKFSINSYTMPFPTIALGKAVVEDEEYFRETVGRIVKTRTRSAERFEELGFKVLPSGSNFLFVTHERIPAKQIFDELRSKNIFVRYFNKARINNYLRVTIGTDEQMDKLFEELTIITK